MQHEAMVARCCELYDPRREMERVGVAGHRTYLLTNTEPLHFEHLRRQIPVLSRFSDLYLSYEVRLVKPDPAYYRTALERFSLEPARCVFVDDRLESVEAARAVGIPAVQQRGDVEEIRRFLREHHVGV